MAEYSTWVCKHLNNGKGFPMNNLLKTSIDYLIKNIVRDWDFTIIIAGEGEVRVGKSVLGQQIGAYWTDQIKEKYGITVPWNVKENFVFNGFNLIKQGNYLGSRHKYAVLDYDEAGADLEGVKSMQKMTQMVRDYLRECGQYNMLNILILPEFFDLPKGIALSRSIFLINVVYTPSQDGLFIRGDFKFYSRYGKKRLYLLGKRDLDYEIWAPDFKGHFSNIYTVDEQEYKDAKRQALKHREKVGLTEYRNREWLTGAVKYLYNDRQLSHREIADIISDYCKIKVSYKTIGNILAGEKIQEEEEN